MLEKLTITQLYLIYLPMKKYIPLFLTLLVLFVLGYFLYSMPWGIFIGGTVYFIFTLVLLLAIIYFLFKFIKKLF